MHRKRPMKRNGKEKERKEKERKIAQLSKIAEVI